MINFRLRAFFSGTSDDFIACRSARGRGDGRGPTRREPTGCGAPGFRCPGGSCVGRRAARPAGKQSVTWRGFSTIEKSASERPLVRPKADHERVGVVVDEFHRPRRPLAQRRERGSSPPRGRVARTWRESRESRALGVANNRLARARHRFSSAGASVATKRSAALRPALPSSRRARARCACSLPTPIFSSRQSPSCRHMPAESAASSRSSTGPFVICTSRSGS